MDTRYRVTKNRRPDPGDARWQVHAHRDPATVHPEDPVVDLLGSYDDHTTAHGVACRIADDARREKGWTP